MLEIPGRDPHKGVASDPGTASDIEEPQFVRSLKNP